MGAQQWTWEDGDHWYYMVDNLSVTDKKTNKETCYQEDQPQFSCDVNPVVKKKGKKNGSASWRYRLRTSQHFICYALALRLRMTK